MGGDDHGGAGVRHRIQALHQLVDPRRIQPRRRLVEQQNAGTHGEQPRDRDPLALAEAEHMGGPVGEVGDAHHRQRPGRALPGLGCRQPQIERAEAHILGDGRRKELIIRVLKDQTDAAPQPGQALAVVGDRGAVQHDLPLIGADRPGQRQQQGGFAGAIGAQNGQPAAGRDRQIDMVERRDAARIMMDQTAGFEHQPIQTAPAAASTRPPASTASRAGAATASVPAKRRRPS